jgi:hypothetical protein
VFYPKYAYLIKLGSTYTLLMKNSDQLASYDGGPQLDLSLITQDDSHELLDLHFPETIQGPKERQILHFQPGVNAEFSDAGLTKAFTDPKYGPVYYRPGAVTLKADAVFSTYNGFYLRAPDGTVRAYAYRPDFIDASTEQYSTAGVAHITWTQDYYRTPVQPERAQNTDKYNYISFTGCGATNYINVVDYNVQRDMTQIGTTSFGDPVYIWTDTNAQRLKDYYTSTTFIDDNNTYQQTQKVYQEFLGYNPLIYWVDPFGRTIELTNAHFGPTAECGKPVIYLYPTSTTNVDVSLAPQGGFTYTEPTYNTGWHVTATPTGQLTERHSGKTYPYLFWEGRGGIYTEPTKGFVVAQADVHMFLTTSLAKLGLNTQETADFIEFWEPRMQGSPYYQVSFMGNRTMDELAPLSVQPKPDSIIRILMDFKPLKQRITIEPQILRTPTRTGFTVVEWGGVLR